MRVLSSLTLFIIVTSAVGCASAPEKRINEKLAQSEPVSSRAELRKEAQELIVNDKGITPDQKKQLSMLLTDVSEKIDSANKESLQLRSLLLKELLQPEYQMAEISVIKKKMRKNDEIRLNAMFDGAEKANKILGRQPAEKKQIYRSFLELDHYGPTAN
ncbi:MAG: hypothetical protein ACXWQO_08755 [Bdellovibrionota bacterium]